MELTEALKQLDSANDAHWTVQGLPAVDVVKGLTDDAEVTRATINAAAGGLTRDTATGYKWATQAPQIQPHSLEDVTDAVFDLEESGEVKACRERQAALLEEIQDARANVKKHEEIKVRLEREYSELGKKIRELQPDTNAAAMKRYQARQKLERARRAKFGDPTTPAERAMALAAARTMKGKNR